MSEYPPQQCCACGEQRKSRNLVTLHRKALTSGKGWGCVQCGLPQDGAVAAICDECAKLEEPVIGFAFDGYVKDGKLVPIDALPNVPHEHNMALHPEVQEWNDADGSVD